MSVFYGVEGKLANMTSQALQKCEKRNGHLFIPAGDQERANLFGDPVYGQVKHIVVTNGNQKYIYPHYAECFIPLEWFGRPTTKWIIIVTCLMLRDYELRKQEYLLGIPSVIKRCQGKGYNIVIVENNGKRPTFLDDFGIPVLYTSNNLLPMWNQGAKEQLDILACINHFGMQDNDFIIKMTGRYRLDDPCNFFDVLEKGEYDAVIRYGNYRQSPQPKNTDCILGLIGMRCKNVKNVKVPESESLELDWGQESLNIENVCCIDKLGLWLAPGNHEFFLV